MALSMIIKNHNVIAVVALAFLVSTVELSPFFDLPGKFVGKAMEFGNKAIGMASGVGEKFGLGEGFGIGFGGSGGGKSGGGFGLGESFGIGSGGGSGGGSGSGQGNGYGQEGGSGSECGPHVINRHGPPPKCY